MASAFLACALPLGIVFSAAAWTAWRLGFPGAPFSLEPFVAKSVWSELGTTGSFGFVCLALTFMGLIPIFSGLDPVAFSSGPESPFLEYGGFNLALLRLAETLRFFAMTCLFTALFFPASSSSLWGWSGIGAAVFDFFLFGIKVFCVQTTFFVGLAYLEGRLKSAQTVKLCLLGLFPLALAGMLLLSLNFLPR